jgi:hypothetical protein
MAPMRAPTWMASPLQLSPRFSHSPTWMPTRIRIPWVARADTNSRPQRTAADGGPPNIANTPSPVCTMRRPPYSDSKVSTN